MPVINKHNGKIKHHLKLTLATYLITKSLADYGKCISERGREAHEKSASIKAYIKEYKEVTHFKPSFAFLILRSLFPFRVMKTLHWQRLMII